MKSVVRALVLLPWLLSTAHARPWEAIKASGTIQVATEGTFPPFNFYQAGKLTGFEIELANALFQKLAVKPVWKSQSFDSLLIGLNQDRYDLVVASHAVTDERQKAVDFSTPHYCSGGVILTKGTAAKGLEDLNGKTVAAQVSSIYPAFLEKQKGLKAVKSFPKDSDGIQALLGGKVDAVVTDEYVALDAAKANKAANLVVSAVVRPERNAMAAAKGNASLKAVIDRTLAELVADGTYEKLSNKYFGRDIRCH